MNSFDITRKFERLLFNGIPEQPEPTWERDGNTNVSMRESGRSQASSSPSGIGDDAEIVGYFIYDFENQTEKYVSVSPQS